jgi:hypothetical protein
MHLHWCWVVHLVFGVRPSSVAIVVEGKNMLKSLCLLAILKHAFLIEPLSPNKKTCLSENPHVYLEKSLFVQQKVPIYSM